MNSQKNQIKILMLALIAVFGHTLHSYGQVQIGSDIDGESGGDFSGIEVSMPDVNTVAVGAYLNDGNGTNSGHVRVYKWNGTMWVQKGADINGEASNDWSGEMVIMPDSNTVAIGARKNGLGDAGHVRIYRWNGVAWVQKGVDLNGEANGDEAGAKGTVSMPDANTVAIGARYNDGSAFQAGHARVFEWNGTAWVQKGTDINGVLAYDQLCAVDMPNPNTIAVGAPGDSYYAQIYDWNGTAWIQRGVNIYGNGGNFGASLNMPDANTVVIGALTASDDGLETGRVKIYEWNGTAWVQKGTDINGEGGGDRLGRDVSMPDANTLLVGAELNDGVGPDAGHARVYKWNGADWVQLGNDIEGESAGDYCGIGLDITDNNTFAIGAVHNDNIAGSSSGHVRIFKLKGVYGWVYNDINQNCIQEELGVVNGITGIIEPGGVVVQTNSDGVWYSDSLPIGNYTITFDTTGNWIPTCPNPINFAVTDPDNLLKADSLGMVNLDPCPEPNISIHMPSIRPGFSDQKIYVKVCNANTGSGSLIDPFVVVSIDDSLTLDASSLAYTNLGNNQFSFDLNVDTLYPGECVNFNLSTTLSANDILGRTVCVEAELFPVDTCALDTLIALAPIDFTPCSLPWDQSSIEVEGKCINDTIVFTITNTGAPGNGDMDCFSPVRLYIDGAYIWLDSIQLLGGDSFIYNFEGDGRTWRLEVDQHPLHPGNSHPNATIERCGNPSNWTPDLVNIFPHDDLDPINDIYCGLISGSYDPNDKTGFPLVGSPGTELEFAL